MRNSGDLLRFACIALVLLLPQTFVAQGAFAQSIESSNGNIRRRVPPDKVSRIFFAWGLQPDCNVRRGFSVLVTNKGQNGEAWVEKTTETIDERWIRRNTPPRRIGQVNRCMGRTAPVISVFYEPRKGFTGFDTVAFTTTNAFQNRQRRFTARILVGGGAGMGRGMGRGGGRGFGGGGRGMGGGGFGRGRGGF